MKRNKKLVVLGLSSLLVLGSGLLSGCRDNQNTPVDPDGGETEEDGKYLVLVSAPTKLNYVVGEYFSIAGISVQRYEVVDGVKSSPVTVSDSDLVLSIPSGTLLNEVSNSIEVTVSLASDPDYKSVSFNITVRDKERVTVTFLNYDGTVLETDANILENATTTYDGVTPSRAPDEEYYYVFDGWYLEGDETETLIDLATFTFSEDTTLVAHYEAREASNSDGLFTYALNGDRTGYIVIGASETDLEGNPHTDLVIPDTFQGLPIVAIGEEAFYANTSVSYGRKITSVTLGANIKEIGANAFYYNEKMETLTLNEGLVSIGDSAFKNCKALTNLLIPTSVVTIADSAFQSCTNLVSIDFQADKETSLTTLGESVFQSCSKLVEVTFPNSLTNVGEDCFTGCGSLQYVNIGQNMTIEAIGNAFGNISNSSGMIKAFGLTPGCTNYEVDEDGVLYTAGKKILVRVPFYLGKDENGEVIPNTTYTIRDEVIEIAPYAFKNIYSFRTIVFGANVKKIDDYAFYTCRIYDNEGTHFEFNDKLEEIGNYAFQSTISKKEMQRTLVMPDSVTTIGDGAFKSCSGIISFTFGANMENFGSDIFNGCSNLAEIKVSENNTKISIGEDGLAVYNKDQTKALFWLDIKNTATSYVMPDTVKEVNPYFLSGKSKITSLVLSSNLEKVGERAFYGMSGVTGSVTLPDTLKEVANQAFQNMSKVETMNVPSSLTYIGDSAFSSCKGITGTVTLSSDLTYLGASAFNSCSNINEVIYNTGLTNESVFSSCSGLTKVTFNNPEFTTISESMFKKCTTLETVDISKLTNLQVIGKDTFNGCSHLINMTLPATLTTIGNSAFRTTGLTEVTIPENATLDTSVFYGCSQLTSATFIGTREVIPSYLFNECSNLATVGLPNGLTTIEEYAFYGCNALESITLPNTLTTLGNNVFSNTGLVSIVLPDSLVDIGTGIFNGCTKLTSVTLPANLTKISGMMFYNCSSLNLSELPATITSFDNYAFYGTGITEFTLKAGQKLDGSQIFAHSNLVKLKVEDPTFSEIPTQTFDSCADFTTIEGLEVGQLKIIQSSAFKSTTSLQTLNFDISGVTEIGSSAFEGSALQSIALPTNENFTSISNRMFYNCKSLTEIVLPTNVTDVATYAFSGCSSLTKLTIENPEITIESYVFSSCTNLSEITFNGTMEQARAVLEANRNCGIPAANNVTVTCSDGSFTL